MIIKMHQHYGHGWVWLDGIDRVQDYGQLGEDGCFHSFEELRAAVAKQWGDSPRSFDDEVWPSWGGVNGTDTPYELPNGEGETQPPITMYNVRTVTGRRKDGTHHILCIIHTEAFLLSDNGDTIERL